MKAEALPYQREEEKASQSQDQKKGSPPFLARLLVFV